MRGIWNRNSDYKCCNFLVTKNRKEEEYNCTFWHSQSFTRFAGADTHQYQLHFVWLWNESRRKKSERRDSIKGGKKRVKSEQIIFVWVKWMERKVGMNTLVSCNNTFEEKEHGSTHDFLTGREERLRCIHSYHSSRNEFQVDRRREQDESN